MIRYLINTFNPKFCTISKELEFEVMATIAVAKFW